MPRPPRIRAPGAYYHVFNRGVECRPIVDDDRDRRMLLRFLGRALQQHGARLFAYCLMDNHYHLFLQTADANLDLVMRDFQGRYVQYFNLAHDRVGPLFQGRYQSPLVQVDAYALQVTRYIHRNPVEAGLITAAALQEYRWSSYPSYTGRLPRWPWLDTEWILTQFHQDVAQALKLFVAFHQVPGGPGPLGTVAHRPSAASCAP